MTVAISKVSFEHYYSPLGVSHPTPRISWSFEGDAKHWTQVAYEIRIVRAGHTETFRRDTDRSVLVDWPSKALSSREHAEVHVRVEGSDGKKTEWFQTSVEAALLSRSDWSAKLITLPHLRDTKPKETSAPGDDDDPCRDGPGESLKPFRLRSSFSVNSTPGQARLYVTACGIHYTYVNGKIVSPDLLEPGWSSYHDHLNYRVYNVTDLIQSGDNVLASWVGEGWFAGRLGWGQGVREMWGNKIGLIAQLEIDGKVVKTTAETEHWTWSYGATEFGEIYDGEKYDTRIDDSEWMVNMLSEQGAYPMVPGTTIVGADIGRQTGNEQSSYRFLRQNCSRPKLPLSAPMRSFNRKRSSRPLWVKQSSILAKTLQAGCGSIACLPVKRWRGPS
jgi:alpha-L-rhamnosidase